MTEAPHSSNGASPAAPLAVRLDGLRRDVESLTARADVLASTQREHGIALETMSELKRQVEQILALLGGEDHAAPGAWFWLTMTGQQHEEKFGELYDWVETVLRVQYPGYIRDRIRPCWPDHPEARWELAWLYQLWSAAYLARRPAPKAAADWHDRWAPGAIRRLGEAMSGCQRTCQASKG